MIRAFWRWVTAPGLPKAFVCNTENVPPLAKMPRPPPLWRGGGR